MKLSIITINYNNAEGLCRTIQSVQSQTFRDFEHIIVDGGSEDGSVEIIEAYASDMARMASGKKVRICKIAARLVRLFCIFSRKGASP